MSLDLGGDDITELLYQLLARIDFPYREANLNRTYDRVLYEFLKENICVLSEVRRFTSLCSSLLDSPTGRRCSQPLSL